MKEQIAALNEIREDLKKENGESKSPFMKLGDGEAPLLNYSLPQSSSFSTYGSMFVDIDNSYFNEKSKEVPKNNYFSRVKEMEPNVLRKEFSQAVQLQDDLNPLLANVKLLRKNIDLNKTNLEAIALSEEVDKARFFEKGNLLNEVQLSNIAKEGFMPIISAKFGGFQTRVNLVKEPESPNPRIYIIEEYKTSSFLGDYGAGRTIQTFSLLPGEKTTISVKTYRDSSSTKTKSENLLDSFSQSSADEMEDFLEEENSSSSQSTSSSSNKAKVEASVSGVIAKVVGASASGGYEYNSNKTSSRTANSSAVNRALSRHVSESNSNRNIEVNTSTTETVTEGEEHLTVREIENINKSRVLNFVFRQLLQEYVSITYLSNIRIAYTNGYMESLRVVDVEDIDMLLDEVIEKSKIEEVKGRILREYLSILNYKNDFIPFIEQQNVTIDPEKIFGESEEKTFWRKTNVVDKYNLGNITLDIPGVILQVQTNILRTQSLVADAILGQGEALDIFNARAQDAISIRENITNLETIQQLEVINSIDDSNVKAEMYKKVFEDCCNCPCQHITINKQ